MPIVLQLVLLLIITWLPGAALYRAPAIDRARREALDADERLFWQVVLSAASALIIALTLAAFGRYRFELVVAGQLVLALLPLVLWRGRLKFTTAPRPTLSA